MPFIRLLLICIIELMTVSQVFAAPPFVDNARLIKGQLANGLHYYLYVSNDEKNSDGTENEFHREKASLKLYIELGYSNELKDQLGYVNLINYMAAEPNFYTYADLSTFEVNLYTVSNDEVLNSLTWFKDIAMGAHLNEAKLADALENSRAVTFDDSDRLLSRDAAYAKIQNGGVVTYQYGTKQTMNQVSVKKLQEFVDNWYQPQRMHVVVAGQINPAQVKQQIETLFGGLTSKPVKSQYLAKPEYKLPTGIYHIVTPQISFSRLYISLPIFSLGTSLATAENYQNHIAHQVINRGIDLFLRAKVKVDKRVDYASTILKTARTIPIIELYSDQFIHKNLTADFTAATQFSLEAFRQLRQNGFDAQMFEALIEYTIEHLKYLGSPLHTRGKPDDITRSIILNNQANAHAVSISAKAEAMHWDYFAKNIKRDALNNLLKQILNQKIYIITMSHEALSATQKLELDAVFDNYNFLLEG